ncbi:MAG TPA: hypothetical protein VF526_02475 [Solirubrobacteraceae bacterium]|jgi:hypothetical protein
MREITSDELDALVCRAARLNAAQAVNGTEVRLHVTVDSETLLELSNE